MKFTKMHGIGNDYIYVNGFTEVIPDKKAAAIALSDRHFGIGSDGLILINPSKVADFEMEMYNSDGSRAEMCGNGIRCVAKYVYDHGMTDKTEFDIETLGGIKHIRLNVGEVQGKKSALSAVVDMGAPILAPADVPADPSFLVGGISGKYEGTGKENATETPFCNEVLKDLIERAVKEGAIVNQAVQVDGDAYGVTCISMGNPHGIVFIDQPVRDFPLEIVGPKFEIHPLFPKHTNTEFVRIIDDHTVEMRVWERGAGETLACGTGACAVAVACMLNGLTGSSVTVKLLGGDLKICIDEKSGHVIMEGPAATVFEGEILL